MKNIYASIVGIILACLTSFFIHENSLYNFRFHLGLYDGEAEERAIEDTLRLFNRHFATFFNTGGSLQGLNEFPAANLIKRRIFQEINNWRKNNSLLVYDRDVFKIEFIKLMDPVSAIALAKEVWFLNVQDIDTRRYISPVKAAPVKVRYFLKKIEKKWQVVEYEVFGEGDEVPPVNKGGF
jgi:hypothetical protein